MSIHQPGENRPGNEFVEAQRPEIDGVIAMAEELLTLDEAISIERRDHVTHTSIGSIEYEHSHSPKSRERDYCEITIHDIDDDEEGLFGPGLLQLAYDADGHSFGYEINNVLVKGPISPQEAKILARARAICLEAASNPETQRDERIILSLMSYGIENNLEAGYFASKAPFIAVQTKFFLSRVCKDWSVREIYTKNLPGGGSLSVGRNKYGGKTSRLFLPPELAITLERPDLTVVRFEKLRNDTGEILYETGESHELPRILTPEMVDVLLEKVYEDEPESTSEEQDKGESDDYDSQGSEDQTRWNEREDDDERGEDKIDAGKLSELAQVMSLLLLQKRPPTYARPISGIRSKDIEPLSLEGYAHTAAQAYKLYSSDRHGPFARENQARAFGAMHEYGEAFFQKYGLITDLYESDVWPPDPSNLVIQTILQSQLNLVRIPTRLVSAYDSITNMAGSYPLPHEVEVPLHVIKPTLGIYTDENNRRLYGGITLRGLALMPAGLMPGTVEPIIGPNVYAVSVPAPTS